MELLRVVGLPGVAELVGAQLPCLECGEQFCLVGGRHGADHDGSAVVVVAVDTVGIVVPVLQPERAGVVGPFPALLAGLGVGGVVTGVMSMNARRPGRDAGTSVISRWPVRSAVSLSAGQSGPLSGGRARIALLVACNLQRHL